MARVAFYAPMKSPGSPVPSGDREMARSLMAAIGANGTPVDLVSEFRIHDRAGDPDRQRTLRAGAAAETRRIQQSLAPDTRLWVTYHNYYKSPDLIGPAVCRARAIPYVQIESTRARSRLSGPWAGFAAAAHDAADTASVIFHLTENDRIALDRDRTEGQTLTRLPPFLPLDRLPAPSRCDGPMLTVAMMRPGDKLRSYTLIARALAGLDGDWRLDIAGDGPARADVVALMAPFGRRVRLLGQLDRPGLQTAYAAASLLFWPGVNEAFGMIYLEAQAAGLPIVAQDRPGVRDVLLPRQRPGPADGHSALTRELAVLLADHDLRRAEGASGRRMIAANHLLGAASDRFWSAVSPLLEGVT